ncbi:TIGR00266 family protein [Anaerotalea alkaliphila]|uniref:TIGR00266 family protein n=1 Tax=Anaerotalea alkaliphila TaxID=2662126 RepID=A0A7X5KPK2_9FIRM|nr:TIGR00266 family protein [Anaerotalea alkaliphila]NDL68252.1 TIGR00266 family protein [Anaerotalea alkaliphila]
MFCANCGAKVVDGKNFCPECGAKMEAGAAPRVQGPADEVEYQLFGDDMQLVEIELDPGESVVAEAGAMTYMEKDIQMQSVFGDGSGKEGDKVMDKILGAGKRALAGESLFMTLFQNGGQGKSHVAFAAPFPGKIIPVELKEFGSSLICQKDAFLCAAKGISISIHLNRKVGAGIFGGEGFIMQKLTGDGLVFLHAGGTIIKKELLPGDMLRVDTGCIVAISETVDYDITFTGDIKTSLFGGEGLFLATLSGRGHVWLQSMPFSRLADRIGRTIGTNRGENRGANNPMGEIVGGLGGLFKNY